MEGNTNFSQNKKDTRGLQYLLAWLQGPRMEETHQHSRVGEPPPGSAPERSGVRGRCRLFLQAFESRSASYRVFFPPLLAFVFLIVRKGHCADCVLVRGICRGF